MKVRIGKLKSKGSNIYEDSYGKIFIGIPNKKLAYIVPKGQLTRLNLIQNRMAIPLLVLVLVGFYLDWLIAIGTALIVVLIFEILYKNIK